jgi:hypothetical protein
LQAKHRAQEYAKLSDRFKSRIVHRYPLGSNFGIVIVKSLLKVVHRGVFASRCAKTDNKPLKSLCHPSLNFGSAWAAAFLEEGICTNLCSRGVYMIGIVHFVDLRSTGL